ncbi:hypothetical protein, partial [Bradyrhizobium liaoningense]|uniref:hypothetical protein n=1 Tax=Bradyrhizobium liaoningense TaxID=43992 RepID=UPI001BAB0163
MKRPARKITASSRDDRLRPISCCPARQTSGAFGAARGFDRAKVYAARTLVRNLLTSFFSRPESFDSICAA